jgi:hypothetical protein
MRASLEKRIAALEEALGNRQVMAVWMPDPEVEPEEFLDRLVSEGRVSPEDRGRVLLVRWIASEEDTTDSR